MPPEEPQSFEKSELIIRRESGLRLLSNGESSALSEIISRSLIHIQTRKTQDLLQRSGKNELATSLVAGDEQEFEIAPDVKILMCWIPPGEFLMGSTEYEKGRRKDEIQHSVVITKGFWMAKTQTTQEQWCAVMDNNPSREPHDPESAVNGVNWDDICDDHLGNGGFMGRINEFSPAGWRFHLPTEAQWEYACRAGTTTALNNGKNITSTMEVCINLEEVAWHMNRSGYHSHPVGKKRPNAWGLYDMHGNVSEWCSDWYGDYDVDALIDPIGPQEGSRRVFRGGNWNCFPDNCRSAVRHSVQYFPVKNDPTMGFRIAMSLIL